MALELIEKKNNPQILCILRDGEVWREVYKSLFIKDLHKIPKNTPWNEFIPLFCSLEEKVAKRYAIYLLSRRAYLSCDLAKKLREKGISPQATEGAIGYCQDKGYVDDQHLLQRAVLKEQRKGLGAKAVFAKLSQKAGMDRQALKCALEKAQSNEEEALDLWLAKQMKKVDRSDPQARRKLAAKLIRRGFSSELVFKKLKLEIDLYL